MLTAGQIILSNSFWKTSQVWMTVIKAGGGRDLYVVGHEN